MMPGLFQFMSVAAPPDDTVKLPDVTVIRFALPPLRTRMKPEVSSASRSKAPDET